MNFIRTLIALCLLGLSAHAGALEIVVVTAERNPVVDSRFRKAIKEHLTQSGHVMDPVLVGFTFVIPPIRIHTYYNALIPNGEEQGQLQTLVGNVLVARDAALQSDPTLGAEAMGGALYRTELGRWYAEAGMPALQGGNIAQLRALTMARDVAASAVRRMTAGKQAIYIGYGAGSLVIEAAEALLRHQGHANYADRGIAFVQIGTLSSRHISDFHLSLGDDYRVSHLNFLLGDTDGFAPAAADYPIKCPIDDLPSACRTAVFGTSILFEDELDLYLSTRASSGANGRTARQLTMATISRAMNRFQSAAVRAAASGAVVTQAAVGQPLTFSYTLSDTVPESAIASRQWTFGNNAPVSGANDATHAFSQAGSVNYSWSATLTDGNVITASGTLTVVGAAPPPSPTVDDVAPGSGTANTTVRMTVTGSNLPLTLVLTLEGANCARVSASSTLALFDCALGAAGPAPMSLWTDAYPNGTAIPSSFTGFLITAP